ncbi:MAG: hypothetical protein ACXAD7_03020 [Candidatus Kariarchaeaceae archaeon]|jgi:hypothetical protein
MGKILVISSCGKKKLVSHGNQPHWNDLDNETKRLQALHQFRDSLTPAGDLYIGPQSNALRTAIRKLRQQYEVDHYIVSAGFGLVKENELLPPYESSFSSKGKSKIREMSSILNIEDSINDITGVYDLIYLALGKDYLTAIGDLGNLTNKANEIIHFGRTNQEGSSFHGINETSLIGNDDIPSITSRVGSFTEAKGSIFLNFTDYITKNRKTEISFIKWWGMVQQELTTRDSQSLETEIDTRGEGEDNSKLIGRGEDYLPSEASKKKIRQEVAKFTNTELHELAEMCNGLRTVNTQKGESRSDWLSRYEDKIPRIKSIYNRIQDLIEGINQSSGDAKGKLTNEYITQLRTRQEDLGIKQYNINQPKYQIFRTIVNWNENPERLKIQSVYTPRTKNGKKKKKKSEFKEPEFDIQWIRKIKEKDSWELHFTFTNKSMYPFQNLKVKFFDSEGIDVNIEEVRGDFLDSISGILHFAFIPASMTDTHKQIRFKFNTNPLCNFDDSIEAEITQEFPAEKREIVTTLELDLLED